MQIFVYEHVTGGGLASQPLPDSLAQEGGAMLRALLEDLLRVPGVNVVTMLDDRLSGGKLLPTSNALTCTFVATQEEANLKFDEEIVGSNHAFVVAPESDSTLLNWINRANHLGGAVVASSPATIDLTSDKLKLATHLQQHGVPCVPSAPCSLANAPPFPPPWVTKPRDGAGSTATRLVANSADIAAHANTADEQKIIVTPYVEGVACSVLFLATPKRLVPLLPGAQEIAADGSFRYLGGRLPLSDNLAHRSAELATRALSTISDLKGFIGVDLILGETSDDDRVVEINPRLTTSYVGLRRLSRVNLAECALRLAQNESIEELTWRSGEVHFTPGGTITEQTTTAPAAPS